MSIADFLDSMTSQAKQEAKTSCLKKLTEVLLALHDQVHELTCFLNSRDEPANFQREILSVIEALKLAENIPNLIPRLQSCRDCECTKHLKEQLHDLCVLLMYCQSKGIVTLVNLAGPSGKSTKNAAGFGGGKRVLRNAIGAY